VPVLYEPLAKLTGLIHDGPPVEVETFPGLFKLTALPCLWRRVVRASRIFGILEALPTC
jgi:hypothetical protein